MRAAARRRVEVWRPGVFSSVGWPEIAVLVVAALFIFGPDKLPTLAADAGRLLRQLRQMARGVRDDLQAELGPEVGDLDFRDLNPRRFVQKHLFEDEETPVAPAPRPAPTAPVRPSLAPGESAPYDADAT